MVGVSLKVTKLICKRQGIPYNPEQMAICPKCNRRTAKIEIKKGKWECIRCGKSGDEQELLRLVNEKYLDEHKLAYWSSRNNRGIK